MTELDKAVPEQNAATPGSELNESGNQNKCVEETSPSTSIAEMADAVMEEENKADSCVEETSPSESVAEVADKETECEEVCEITTSPALDISEAADTEMKEEAQGPRFHSMNKDELIARLKEYLDADKMDAHREVTALKQAFFNIRTKENLEELNSFVEAGNDPAAFSATPDEKENEFKELYTQFKERRAAFIAADEAKRKENLGKKQEIIAKIKDIASDIDNVNLKFPEFQQLQQDFKAIREIPAGAENEVWKEFQTAVEQFYDHLKMNKELRDLDFRKNLEVKRSLIDEAKSLASVGDPVAAFRRLQTLHDEWRNIGPVAKDIRESVWEEFREASTVVNRRYQEYFEQRKANELANEAGKTKICEEIEAINLDALKSFAEWNEKSDRIIALQKEWKGLGFATRKVNNVLYTRFRAACDRFFNAKTEYFQRTKDEFNTNLEKKIALCERAEALKNSDNLKKASDEIVRIQAEWKEIGSVPRKQSDAIWQRFQTACNYFFDERKKQSNARRKEENANLDAKNKVIEALKGLPLDGDRKDVIGKVKELQAEWQNIGFVPFKLKDKIYAEYREICDKLYETYDSRESRNRVSNFHNKVADMKDDSQKGRERDRLVRTLESRRNELQTIENNMGFFNVKSSAGNSVVKEMERKIERLKKDIEEIREKIAILDESAN